MAMIFQWLVRATAAAIVLTVLAFAMVYYLASRSLPNYSATVKVPAISAPVEIVRDNANVPHIFGETDTDVFHALGFAHTQDRLWQMMMMRRTAQGRLSELFGTATVEVDSFVRRLDIYRLSVQSIDALDAATLTAPTCIYALIKRIDDRRYGARPRQKPLFACGTIKLFPNIEPH